MAYLDLLKNGSRFPPAATCEPGKTLAHPWKNKTVNSRRGQGVLVWTDGFRAAVAVDSKTCYFVGLASIRLVESEGA